MRLAPILAVVALVSLAACGGIAGSENRSTSSEMDAATEGDPGDGAADSEARDSATTLDVRSDSTTDYSGLLRATLRSNQAGAPTRSLDVSFWPGPQEPPRAPSCGNDGITMGSCCGGILRIGLPIGTLVPLSAGNVTISLRGTPFATLLPPDYAAIGNAMWSAGDVLGVDAAGGNIAPFSGSLATPTLIAGVTPAFGSTPFAITRGSDLRVAWTPEAKDGEQMQLQIDMIEAGEADVILCAIPDSAGAVVVDASLLARPPSGTTGSIHLTRSITSNASGADVTVALVGEVWLDALATVQ